MDRRKLFLWTLYDFANSIVYITFILYFAQWLVIDGGLSDFWYNAIFAITTLLLLASAPALAAYTDKNGGRKKFLAIATIGTAVSYVLAVLAAYDNNMLVAALLFLAGQYFYQLSFVFYNAMIEDVADIDHRARASGIGQFGNALGQVAGLLLALFIGGSRLSALIPATVVFFVLTLPFLIFFKETTVQKNEQWESASYFNRMWHFYFFSAAAPLLVAYFFFNDALITVTNNYSIFIERVFATPDTEKNLLLIAVVAMAGIGGALSGWIADKIGPERSLHFILIAIFVILPMIAFSPTFMFFAVLTIPVSLLIGAILAVSRAYLSRLLPSQDMTYGFSFFTLSERFATLFGPLTWGFIVTYFESSAFAYRTAMISMMAFILVGILVPIFFKKRYVSKISD